MRITLDYKIDIDVREGNKSKDKLSVFLREFTRDEKREHTALQKKFKDIFKKAMKYGKQQASLDKKAELYELNGDYEKSLSAIEKKEELEEKVEELQAELETLNGEDQESFEEELARSRFDTLVSGKDKDKLESLAEIKGYAALMSALDKAKDELEKKQSGE